MTTETKPGPVTSSATSEDGTKVSWLNKAHELEVTIADATARLVTVEKSDLETILTLANSITIAREQLAHANKKAAGEILPKARNDLMATLEASEVFSQLQSVARMAKFVQFKLKTSEDGTETLEIEAPSRTGSTGTRAPSINPRAARRYYTGGKIGSDIMGPAKLVERASKSGHKPSSEAMAKYSGQALSNYVQSGKIPDSDTNYFDTVIEFMGVSLCNKEGGEYKA